MSDSMNRQVIVLTVSYDPEQYEKPSEWNWEDLVGSYCRVLKSGEVEHIFKEREDC